MVSSFGLFVGDAGYAFPATHNTDQRKQKSGWELNVN